MTTSVAHGEVVVKLFVNVVSVSFLFAIQERKQEEKKQTDLGEGVVVVVIRRRIVLGVGHHVTHRGDSTLFLLLWLFLPLSVFCYHPKERRKEKKRKTNSLDGVAVGGGGGGRVVRVLGVLGTVVKDLRRVSLRLVALRLGRGGERVGGKGGNRRTRRRETGTKSTRSSSMASSKTCKRSIAIAVAVAIAIETSRSGKRRNMRTATRRRKGLRLRRELLLLRVGRGFVGLLHLHTEQLQTFLDVVVVGIEVGGLGVGIERVTQLVARLVQRAQIVPHLAQVGVETDRPAVRIQCIPILLCICRSPSRKKREKKKEKRRMSVK